MDELRFWCIIILLRATLMAKGVSGNDLRIPDYIWGTPVCCDLWALFRGKEAQSKTLYVRSCLRFL